jgi:hypothetical protein
MKTTEKKFDAVEFMRQQRDELSKKLGKMTKEEILQYFLNQKKKKKIKPSA